MKILVIGSGGREHAMAWKLAQSPKAHKVFVAPGNGGTARDQRLTNIAITDVVALREWAQAHPAQELKTVLGRELPKRFVDKLVELGQLVSKPMRQYNERELDAVATLLGDWQILPNGTEGYRTAEVTLGGVDTNELSSKTMEARKVPGLYFVGGVVDVTGWLGGYNFQWAWSSGWVAGQYC